MRKIEIKNREIEICYIILIPNTMITDWLRLIKDVYRRESQQC